MRLWLKGEKEGAVEVFLDTLPGFPDNVHLSKPDGNFYIGLPGVILLQSSQAVTWWVVGYFLETDTFHYGTKQYQNYKSATLFTSFVNWHQSL